MVAQVVRSLPPMRDPNLLVGADKLSDAGVYRLADDLAIVQTTDFFPPVVDDPYTYGRIAAANALGDLYAMGATPRTALNIVGFPDDELGLDILERILKGGAERVLAAGAVTIGGHSVRDREIKYGLAVTGTVHPDRMMTNAGARPGDALILTKPLGTGLIATANRGSRCPSEALEAACASMVALNAAPAEAAVALGARAATDITGYGLAGHALELARASGVTIELELGRLPVLAGALELATPDNFARANATNREHVGAEARFVGDDRAPRAELAFDPQTSGGLLIAIDPERAAELVERCRAGGAGEATVVGRATDRGEHALLLHA